MTTITAHGRSYEIEADPASLIGRPIADGRPYEQNLLEHIWEQDFEGVAVDAGAHIGNHTLYLAAVCGLTVHAFEPLCVEQLKANAALNPDLDIHVHPNALGAGHTFAESMGKGRLETGGGAIYVAPLDAFNLENVSVIKADVEDMECDLLRGAEATILRDRPALYLEARDEAAHDALAEILEPWEYSYRLTAKTSTPVEWWMPA